MLVLEVSSGIKSHLVTNVQYHDTGFAEIALEKLQSFLLFFVYKCNQHEAWISLLLHLCPIFDSKSYFLFFYTHVAYMISVIV